VWCDHVISLFLRAQTLPIHFLYYKLLAETMHDVSNDVIPSQLKYLFIPTVKIHSYNTRSSVSDNFYIKKSKLEIKWKSFSVTGAKRKISVILFNILESEDSYEDLESIISKVRLKILSIAISFVSPILCRLFIFVSFILLSYHIALSTSINYIAVSVDLICFRVYLFLFICSFKWVFSGPPRLALLSAEPGD